MKHIENIVIGKPIVPIQSLLGVNEYDESWKEVTIFEEERNLADIIVKNGIMTSKREIRRNRPDLIKELDKLDCFQLKIGKKFFFIIVGAKEEEYEKIIKETEDKYFKIVNQNNKVISTFSSIEEWNIDVLTILQEEKGNKVIEIDLQEYNKIMGD